MRLLLFSILVFALFSCSRISKSTNSKVIESEILVNVMYDIHYYDALQSMYNTLNAEKQFLSKEFYEESVFKKYNIDRKLFIWNIIYYSDINRLEDMYTLVILRMKRDKFRIENQSESK